MPTDDEPRTEAGRRLDTWVGHAFPGTPHAKVYQGILAIERESSDTAEAQVRQLREALQRIMDKVPERAVSTAMWQIFEIAREALAAVDGAVPAAVSDEQRECDRACTSGCHADDCEHHASRGRALDALLSAHSETVRDWADR